MEKWLRRVTSFGASPPAPGDLRLFIPASTPVPTVTPTLSEPVQKEAPSRGAEGRLLAPSNVLAALPTPARRAAQAPHSISAEQTTLSGAASASAATGAAGSSSSAAGPSSQHVEAPCPQRLPPPRPTVGASSAAAPSTSHPQQISKMAASEPSSSTWPAPQATAGREGQPSQSQSPRPAEEHKEQKASSQNTRGSASSSSSVLAPSVSKDTTATATAASGASVAADRSPEPLVELTHVLNMVAPWPTQGLTSSHADKTQQAEKSYSGASAGSSAGKPRAPSVAAELLVSSALRMHWPVDRRKATPAEAAATCVEAAEILREAANQLLGAADRLKVGGAAAVPKPGAASESKRRRTFGGPSPVARASSPGASAGGPPTTTLRGSPPVRFSGLRV